MSNQVSLSPPPPVSQLLATVLSQKASVQESAVGDGPAKGLETPAGAWPLRGRPPPPRPPELFLPPRQAAAAQGVLPAHHDPLPLLLPGLRLLRLVLREGGWGGCAQGEGAPRLAAFQPPSKAQSGFRGVDGWQAGLPLLPRPSPIRLCPSPPPPALGSERPTGAVPCLRCFAGPSKQGCWQGESLGTKVVRRRGNGGGAFRAGRWAAGVGGGGGQVGLHRSSRGSDCRFGLEVP